MAEEFDPVAYINTPRWQTVDLGLDRIVELMERLGNPQRGMKVVHVAGTNGKGSVCAFTDSILRQAGYTVGLFTSPYIFEFAERIRINGANIAPDELLACTLLVREQAEAMAEHPTEFELMTAVALVAFARAAIDIAVLEVGMGGRLDSTNVIDAPEVCAITPIALDHVAILGDTVAKIAGEKAGIIKTGATVVSAHQEADAAAVIREKAAECGCNLREVDLDVLFVREPEDVDLAKEQVRQVFSYRTFADVETRLLARYQPENAALAIEVALALRERGFALSDEMIRRGIAATEWPGRFQVVGYKPLFIIDGGHNQQGAHELAASLNRYFPGRAITFVLGVLGDKEYEAMLAEIAPLKANYVLVEPPNPRALSVAKLLDALMRTTQATGGCVSCLRAYPAESIVDGVQRAVEAAGPDGIVVAFGSLYSLKDVMDAYRAIG